MTSFEAMVLGVGDAFTSRHCSSALVLTSAGVHLAIDCPDRYRQALRMAGERGNREIALSQIEHFLITHLHGDHVNGLEAVAFYKHFVDQQAVHLLAMPEVLEVTWEQRLAVAMGQLWDGTRHHPMRFADYFQATELACPGETVCGPFRIRARPTRHHIPSCALLIEAAGRRLAYSGDTAYDADLIAFLDQADLIIHETNHGPAHTALTDLLSLPTAITDKMRLIHYPDELDVEHCAIRPLREGEVLTV